jgi:hypothetical protein
MPLKPGSSPETVSENIREFHHGNTYAHTEAKFGKKDADRQAVAVAMETARKSKRKRKRGGKVAHVGRIVGPTGGRADKRAMEVPDGSYVLTADHVSGLGEGNTHAGMEKLDRMFPKSAKAHHEPKTIERASGGKVPIYAADGEYVVHPEDIKDRYGDLDYGHKALDEWQTYERQQLIHTLKNLDPPARD